MLRTIACLFAVAALLGADDHWRTVAGLRVPVLRVPLYVMEFHLWYDAPVGQDGRPGWYHGGPAELADTATMGPDWMRMRQGVGWPLPGAYDSGDTGIIRWQLQCLKATGVDGVFVQLYADWNHPETFHRLPQFERLLAIAEEVGIKVGIHDEVQFRPARAKEVATFAQRAGAVLAKYATSPAYLRIDGRPAYAFQWWGQLEGKDFPAMTHAQLQQVFDAADALGGEHAFYMPFHHAADRALLALPGFGGGVVMSNSNNQFREVGNDRHGRFTTVPGWTDAPLPPAMIPEEVAILRQARSDFPDKRLGLWAYPGFNNTTQRAATGDLTWLPRIGGRTLAEAFAAFQEYGCDFVMLSSWNDWEENTAIEPGFMYDGYAGDPYLSCRIVAAAKDRDFVPPPLPPKESVDPLMWQRLYGIDRTPPHLSRLRYLPMEAALVAEVVDSGSAVAGADLRTAGDLSYVAGGAGDGLEPSAVPVLVDGAVHLKPDAPLILRLDTARLAGCSELWVAVTYAGEARGRLVIGYPAGRTIADDQPGDEGKVRLEGSISLAGDTAWRSAVRLLRVVQPAADKPLSLRLAGKGALRIARVDIFRPQAGGTAGLEISGAAATSQVKTFRLATPGLQAGPLPGTVFLEFSDAAGNRSPPLPVCGTDFPAGFGNLP
jgi:hypothetical protein